MPLQNSEGCNISQQSTQPHSLSDSRHSAASQYKGCSGEQQRVVVVVVVVVVAITRNMLVHYVAKMQNFLTLKAPGTNGYHWAIVR
jgi:hypothetical protein